MTERDARAERKKVRNSVRKHLMKIKQQAQQTHPSLGEIDSENGVLR